MRKKSIELSVQDLQAKVKGKSITRGRKVKDSEIDFSDIPEQTTEELKKFKRVGRPLVGSSLRVPVNIRIEENVLESIKKKAKKKGIPYQSLINEILKKEAS